MTWGYVELAAHLVGAHTTARSEYDHSHEGCARFIGSVSMSPIISLEHCVQAKGLVDDPDRPRLW